MTNKETEAYDHLDQWWKVDRWPEVEYSTYLGYIAKASTKGRGIIINRNHFRYRDDLPLKKAHNEIRIFVTGGSTAFGSRVDQEYLYTTLIEKNLQEKFPDKIIRVICAGLNAYCTTQERILIENYIVKFNPDCIIMFSGWNDTYFGYLGKRILEDQDYWDYRKKIQGTVSEDNLNPPDYDKYFLKLHFVIDKCIYKITYNTPHKLLKAIKIRERNPGEVLDTALYNIHIIVDLSRRYHFVLLYCLQPSIYCTGKDLTPWEQKILKTGENQYIGFSEYNRENYKNYRRTLPRDASQNGYFFKDADPWIVAEKKTLFRDHVHFGDRGYRLLAAGMSDELMRIMPHFHSLRHMQDCINTKKPDPIRLGTSLVPDP